MQNISNSRDIQKQTFKIRRNSLKFVIKFHSHYNRRVKDASVVF